MVARAYHPENVPDSPAPEETLTPQEYLRREREAETKTEFIGGELFAMSGASFSHTRINHSIARHLGNQLQGKPCEVVSNDLRVKVNEVGDYVYPDVVVVCNGGEWEDNEFDTLLNPTVIIEVLSVSTAKRDRDDKWRLYQQLPSLNDYLMVAQNEVRVEHFTRQNENLWLYTAYTTLEAEIDLTAIDCRLSLRDIYERITFAENPPG